MMTRMNIKVLTMATEGVGDSEAGVEGFEVEEDQDTLQIQGVGLMEVIVEDLEETSEEHREGIPTDNPEVASEAVVLVVHVVAMGVVAMETAVATEEASVEPPEDAVAAAMVDMMVASRRGEIPAYGQAAFVQNG
ncbi:hypothetical protein E2C01_042815 [Portunus trituberculatus]|uniref:Uncharacterized protein n=1 Tax=Portunus trituberculatus TaxID=210409 RepID=A0A5B7FUE7_PORTR|nr:hypothetical protein [Portunus trituberculatus]